MALTELHENVFSQLKYRGAFLSLYGLMVGLGITLCYSLGAGLYWRLVALLPPLLYLALFAGLLLVPESPLWLLGHTTPDQARGALQWLRNSQVVWGRSRRLRTEVRLTPEFRGHGAGDRRHIISFVASWVRG